VNGLTGEGPSILREERGFLVKGRFFEKRWGAVGFFCFFVLRVVVFVQHKGRTDGRTRATAFNCSRPEEMKSKKHERTEVKTMKERLGT
jgi:hypothetical protein